MRFMDHLDKARVHIVKAMGALENALSDGLPAQSPRSNAVQVESGIEVFKRRIDEALSFVAKAEAALDRAKTRGS